MLVNILVSGEGPRGQSAKIQQENGGRKKAQIQLRITLARLPCSTCQTKAQKAEGYTNTSIIRLAQCKKLQHIVSRRQAGEKREEPRFPFLSRFVYMKRTSSQKKVPFAHPTRKFFLPTAEVQPPAGSSSWLTGRATLTGLALQYHPPRHRATLPQCRRWKRLASGCACGLGRWPRAVRRGGSPPRL